MKIAVGCDHAGYAYKREIITHLLKNGYEVTDVGTRSNDPVDYPIYGRLVAGMIVRNKADLGIIICGTGEGIMMAANKIKGIRAGIGYDDEVSRLIKEHNDANIIAFGARYMALEDVLRRIDIFLKAEFLGERHAERVKLIED